MAISSGFSDMYLKDICRNITEFQIATHYLGITSLPCLIKAPYRRDLTPSLSIYEYGNKVRYKDFGTGESGGIFDLLMKLWRCSFEKCISQISNDIIKIQQSNHVTIQNNSHYKQHPGTHSNVEIKVKFREWKQYDIDYWESYGISLEWLKFGDVYPISRIFYINDGKMSDWAAEKYAYAYIERKDNVVTMKIYQPKSDKRKWISKHDSSVWDLWTKIPKWGERLIITSSRKDALCVWENTGIPCVSMQGEGYIPKEHVINELKSRFKRVFILYDNDFSSSENHGRIFASELSERFNLHMIEIPDEYKSKDPSDLCLNHGRETVRNVITKLVLECEIKMDNLLF